MRRLIFIYCMMTSSILPLYGQEKACYKDIQKNFFDQRLVGEAFSLHNVYQSQWDPFYRALDHNARDVPRIIRYKARSMSPNPFHPFKPKEAAQLLIETLYEVFVTTMWQLNYTNQVDIDEMFQYIREKQQNRINSCLGLDIELKFRTTMPK